MEKREVNKQFKILYAVAIFLVVAGHYANGGVNILFDWFKVYAFHVGLFVFCSGYFYNKDNEERMLQYIWGRVKKLIIPLYAWNVFYGLLVLLLNRLGFGFDTRFSWYNLLIAPLNDGHQFFFNLASWFIAPLFMVQVFVVVVRKILKAVRLENEILLFGIFMLIGMAGVWLATKGYHDGWWLALSRFCYFLPFYAMGRLYKTVLEEKMDKIKSTLYFLVVFGAQTVIIVIYNGVISSTPSKCNDFHNCIVPFVIGFIGIAFWVRCAKLLEPVMGDAKVVRLLADNTFSIMMHHFLGFFLIKLCFAVVKYYGIACSSFDLELFRTDIMYTYLPFGVYQFALLMVLGSIVFSIIFGKIPGLFLKKKN